MGVAATVETAASCGPRDEAQLNEKRLDHVLDRVARLAEAGGERLHADRTTAVEVGDHRQIAAVHRVEAQCVDLEPGQRFVGGVGRDGVRTRRVGEIADLPEQTTGDPRRASRAARDLLGAVRRHVDAEQPRRAAHDQLQLLDRVEVQPDRNPEAVAKRGSEETLPGRRADQGETRKVDLHRARRRAFADHEIERAVLHRGIEHLLDRGVEAMDLVDEQDVAVLEVREQRREVARLGDHGPGGGAEADTHLAREDSGERRLAEARRPVEQHVVERFAAALRCADEDPQIFAGRLLTDELVEALRPKRRVGVLAGALGESRDSGGVGGHQSR